MDIKDSEERRWKIWEIHFSDLDVLEELFPFVKKNNEQLKIFGRFSESQKASSETSEYHAKYEIIEHLWKAGKLDTEIKNFPSKVRSRDLTFVRKNPHGSFDMFLQIYDYVFLQYYEGEKLTRDQLVRCFCDVTIFSESIYPKEFNSYLDSLTIDELFHCIELRYDTKKYVFDVIVRKLYEGNYIEYDKVMKQISLYDKYLFLSLLAVEEMKMKSDRVHATMNEILKSKSPGETAILIYNVLNKSENRRKRFDWRTNFNLISILWNIELNYSIEILDFFVNTDANIYKEILDCDLEFISKSEIIFRFLSMIASKFLLREELISLGIELKNQSILEWYHKYTSQV